MKQRILLLVVLLSFLFVDNLYSQDFSKFKPMAVNGYYYKNIVPFTDPSRVGFGVVIPAYINKDSLIDFYTTKLKYPQNVDPYEISKFEIYINQGNFTFKKETNQYVRDSILIIRDDGINAIDDLNNDGINDLIFAGEPFHYNPQSAYFNLGIKNKVDVDSSKYYARRPNVLISNNGKLVDSIGFLESIQFKSYNAALIFDWNNDGKKDLVLAEQGDGKTFQFWENNGSKMSLTYPIQERDTLIVAEGPFNISAYDLNKDGFKDFIFSSQVEGYISKNGNVYVSFNENGKFNNSSVMNIINYRELPVEKNGLRPSDIQIDDLDKDGNPEIIALFSPGSGTHSAIDVNKIKSVYKIITYKDLKFTDVTKKYFPTNLNENLYYSNRQFKLIDLDNDGLKDLYPITGDNGCTENAPRGCGNFGYQGIDSTVYFKNKNGVFELKSLGLFFSDTTSQNIYNEFKSKKINIGGFNLSLGNQIVPFMINGFSKPVFIAGTQKNSVEMYDGEIYNDSLKNFKTRITQNSFINYNYRTGFVMVPCDNSKPIFNTSNFTICGNDSLKISVTNVNKGDTLKWYYGSKSDFSNVSSKIFNDTTSFYVTRTDSIGCVSNSDIIQVKKYNLPSTPTISRDTANNLVSSAALRNTWYKDGTAISDTTQKIKPSGAGSFTVKTSENGCTSVASNAYYYLVTDVINLSADEFIKLAPNPFQGQLNFDFNVKGYQKLNVEVFELTTGTKRASQQNVLPGSVLTFGFLAPGTYIIKVSSADQKLSHQFKMIKL
jgi:hypothetical protein